MCGARGVEGRGPGHRWRSWRTHSCASLVLRHRRTQTQLGPGARHGCRASGLLDRSSEAHGPHRARMRAASGSTRRPRRDRSAPGRGAGVAAVRAPAGKGGARPARGGAGRGLRRERCGGRRGRHAPRSRLDSRAPDPRRQRLHGAPGCLRDRALAARGRRPPRAVPAHTCSLCTTGCARGGAASRPCRSHSTSVSVSSTPPKQSIALAGTCTRKRRTSRGPCGPPTTAPWPMWTCS